MIKLVEIHKIYKIGSTGYLALKDINLDFTNNHFVCILGKSGSGKTTLLNIIGGLDQASSGHMVIDGMLTTKFTETQWDFFRNHKIGFIFQNYSLIEHLNVLDNVMIASKLQGEKQIVAKEKALELLRKVQIEEHAFKLPGQLSGGERQRVAIARALINDPEIILADEPTGSLDKKTSASILDLLKSLSQDKLVIMVTHNRRLANLYADRIIELKDGAVVLDSAPESQEKVKIYKPKHKQTKFSLRDKIKHAVKNIRMKKWRSFLTALGLSIGIAGFVIINGLGNGLRINYKRQLSSINQGPRLRLTMYEMDEHNGVEDYLELIERHYGVTYARLASQTPLKITALDADRFNEHQMPTTDYTYTFVNQTDELKQYFGPIYGDGKYPDKDDEIVISRRLAEKLYDYENLELLWSKLKNAQIEVASKYYYQADLSAIYNNQQICKAYDYINEETSPPNYDAARFGAYKQQLETQKDLFGQILLFEDYDPVQGVILSHISFCDDYNPFIMYLKSSAIKATKTFTIVGIFEYGFPDESLMTKEAFFDIYDQNLTYSAFEVFVEETISAANLYKLKDNLANQNGFKVYEVRSEYDYQTPIFNAIITMLQFVMSVIMLVSVITAGIMLLMVLMISVIERSREIGILRSLGATRNDILAIFTVESGVLGFIAGIIGNVLAVIFSVLLNMLIRKYYAQELIDMFYTTDVNVIIIKPIYGFYALLICILLAMLFGLLPAFTASKKTPINALKRIKS